jgi:hypothetical protein
MPHQQKVHPFLYWEYPEYGIQQAVRIGKWKGLRMNIGKGNLKLQLFDLDSDLQEQHDVAAQHLDKIKQMEDIMKKEHYTPEVANFRMKALENE